MTEIMEVAGDSDMTGTAAEEAGYIYGEVKADHMTGTANMQESAGMTGTANMQEPAGMTGTAKADNVIKAEEADYTNGEANRNGTEEGKLVNEMRLCFQSRGENESLARIAVAGFIACLDPTLDVLDDIRTAVSEAVTNAIIHGYQGTTDGIIYLSAFLYEDGDKNRLLRVDVEDTGIGIENVEKAMEPMYTTSLDGERAGMGFAFMAAFTDRLEVESGPRLGTCVSMWKKMTLPEAAHDAE